MKNVELNRDIIDKIKAKTPDLIREFMQSDLMKMILYSSCARVEFKGNSDIDIALLVQGNRTDSWKYNDKSDELEKTRIEIFCDCKFCSPSL